MDERIKIADELRAIASEIENGFPEEEQVRRELMGHLKRMFIHYIIDDPRHKHENPGKIWDKFKEDIIVDIKKLKT